MVDGGANSPLRVQLDALAVDPTVSFREVGSTGLRQFGGFIQEEFLNQLQWPLAARVFREMGDNDAVASAMLTVIDLLERQVTWRTKPADDSRLAQEIADHCDSCRVDMEDTWGDTQSSWGSARQFGFSLHEKIYKYRRGPKGAAPTEEQPFGVPPSKFDDGKIGWANLPIRAQDTIWRWEYATTSANERLIGANQRTLTHPGVIIPMGKVLHFRVSPLKANPLGRSMFRGAWRSWMMKRRIEEIEGIGIERELAGMPIVWVPPNILSENATSDQKALLATMRDTVKNVRNNEAMGLVLPREIDENGNAKYAFELATSGGQRQIDIGKTIERYDHRILLQGMTDFLLLGAQGVGSLGFSMGTVRVDLFSASMDADLNMQAQEITDNGYRELVELNGWPLELTPTLVHDEIQEVDVTKIFDAVLKLAQAGVPVFPDPQLTDWLLDQLNAPHMSADEKDAQDAQMEAEITARVNAALAAQQTAAEQGAEVGPDGLPTDKNAVPASGAPVPVPA